MEEAHEVFPIPSRIDSATYWYEALGVVHSLVGYTAMTVGHTFEAAILLICDLVLPRAQMFPLFLHILQCLLHQADRQSFHIFIYSA